MNVDWFGEAGSYLPKVMDLKALLGVLFLFMRSLVLSLSPLFHVSCFQALYFYVLSIVQIGKTSYFTSPGASSTIRRQACHPTAQPSEKISDKKVALIVKHHNNKPLHCYYRRFFRKFF